MTPGERLADAVDRAELAVARWVNENRTQVLGALEDGDDDDRAAAGELRALLEDWRTASRALLTMQVELGGGAE